MRTRIMDDSQRRHGFTTLQMQKAPTRALYIWPVRNSLDYAKALAHALGRDDLEIVSGHVLERGAERLRGRTFTGIVLDHACDPTEEEYYILRDLRASCVRGSVES